MQSTYLEGPIIESPILSILEEISKSILILECIVNIIWDAFPVGNRLRICAFYWWSFFRVESAKLN